MGLTPTGVSGIVPRADFIKLRRILQSTKSICQ